MTTRKVCLGSFRGDTPCCYFVCALVNVLTLLLIFPPTHIATMMNLGSFRGDTPCCYFVFTLVNVLTVAHLSTNTYSDDDEPGLADSTPGLVNFTPD